MDNEYLWSVCVRCFTFNHKSYITDSLNGFTMQETTFPFVCTIVDDASTDGEQEVIKNYLQEHFDLEDKYIVRNEETDDYFLTFARHKTNLNCYFAVLYLKYNHYSIKKSKMRYIAEWQKNCKYIALCEGDDYWIDSHKLHKQAFFLENNNSFSLIGTNGLIIWEKNTNPPSYFSQEPQNKKCSISELAEKWSFPTASVFFRRTVMDNYPDWTKKIYSGDQTLILISASKGDVYYMSDLTCVYRKSDFNKYSMSSTIGGDGNIIFVREQQLLLLNEFSKWTHNKYEKELANAIKIKKEQLKYAKLRKKSRILPYIIMPLYALNNKIEYIKKTLNRI